MQYAVIFAVVGLAAAVPADWEPVKKTTTPAWEPVKVTTTAAWEPVKPTTTKCSSTSTYTTKVCGDKKDAWDNCHIETKYTVVYPEKCDWAPITTPAAWVPAPAPTKCSTVSSYTTKECGAKKGDEWDNCKVVTKYTTLYPEKCDWAPVTTPAAWVPEPAKCSSYSTYVTKECGDKKDAWDNCKEVTKTTLVYPTVCPTPVKATETWAPAPVAPSSKPVAPATTSSWSPVATFKGAADKQTFGMGALAIAAVAALL